MKVDGISEALRALRVPEGLLRAVPDLPKDAEGLLVYGSQARGDAVEGSDLDLWVLIPAPRPSDVRGDVSVSFYTPAQLRSGVGTLFGAHLRRDSRVLWDPTDRSLPDVSSLHECLHRLQAIIGEFPQSTHGSLEATIVNEWGRRGDLLSAAFLALGSTGTGSVYAEVEKILL